MSEPQPPRRRRITLGPAVPVSGLPEFLEAPFPERRTIHWLPPDRVVTEKFSIVITPDVLLQTSRHVAGDLEKERGGFLLGNRYRCPNTGREYTVIDQYVEADYVESTDVSLTFTHEAWGQLEEKLTGKFYGKKLVGWYHSHPGMSIFLSEHDKLLHEERFAEPWMVALVLEPKKNLGGFFAWSSDGKLDPNHYVNFYELLEGEQRKSVVSWKNYEGFDPLLEVPPQRDPLPTSTEQSGGEPPFTVELSTGEEPRRGFLPLWLQGNLTWFLAGVLLLLIFVVSAAYVGKDWLRPAPQEDGANPFAQLEVEPLSRGSVDFGSNKISVQLKVRGLPEQVARGMKATVLLDGRMAQIRKSWDGRAALLEASAMLREKVTGLKDARIDETGIRIAGTFEYNGSSGSFERPVKKLQVLEDSGQNLALADFPEIDYPDPTPEPTRTPTATPTRTPRPPAPTPTRPPGPTPTPRPTPAPQSGERKLQLQRQLNEKEAAAAALNERLKAVKDKSSNEYKTLARTLVKIMADIEAIKKKLRAP